MNLWNLTPHTVVVAPNGGDAIHIPKSGWVARVVTYRQEEAPIDGVPTVSVQFGRVRVYPADAPDSEGVLWRTWLRRIEGPRGPFIVARIVAQALRREGWKGELLVPDTSLQGAIRDSHGRIAAVRALERWP